MSRTVEPAVEVSNCLKRLEIVLENLRGPPALKNQSLFELARVLGILGGLLTLLAGVFDLESLFSAGRLPSLEALVGILGVGTVLVVLGGLALVGSGRVRVVAWDILLVMVGVLAFSLGARFPWEWGSILVVLGGMVGIVGRLA